MLMSAPGSQEHSIKSVMRNPTQLRGGRLVRSSLAKGGCSQCSRVGASGRSSHVLDSKDSFAFFVGVREIQDMVKLDMEAIRKLSVSERLALVEEIWESISDDPTSVPVSEAQLAEARRRLAEHDADPTTAVPWDEAEERLRAQT